MVSAGKLQLISWNGVQLSIPEKWETVISSQRSIVFENDFTPMFQIRWESIPDLDSVGFEKQITGFSQQLHPSHENTPLPKQFFFLRDAFDFANAFYDKQEDNWMIMTCKRSDRSSEKLFFFHIMTSEAQHLELVCMSLSSILCHDQEEQLFKVQDFSITVPPHYLLKDYTFAAGLTRLSFAAGKTELHICKLASADRRIDNQSLPEILSTLAGVADLKIEQDSSKTVYEGRRMPSIFHQVLFRLRRKKPFILGRLRHEKETNRILAAMLFSNHPIDSAELSTVFNSYEIVS